MRSHLLLFYNIIYTNFLGVNKINILILSLKIVIFTPLQIACETFCLDDSDTMLETSSLGPQTLSSATVRSVKANEEEDLSAG